MPKRAFLAFDLGAESGRSILGVLHNNRIELRDLNRFANSHVNLPSGLHWNLTNLYANMVDGLALASRHCAEHDCELVSLGVDTWGVDFGLIGRSGQLLGMPFIYRDPRTVATMQQAFDTLGRERIYHDTGVQFMNLNSLYQLLALQQSEPALIAEAERLLFTPDLMHYFFTGEAVNEATIASTSQMVNPRHTGISTTGEWAVSLLEDLGLSTHMLGPIAPAGTTVGVVRDSLASEIRGGHGVKVVAPASHDTASAVVAAPAQPGTNWCYLSCGTWSLLGAELDQPVITDAAREAPFTNEGGYGGTVRFLQNITGLWMVQECRRDYDKRGETFDYATLTQLAADAPPFRTIVETRHSPFLLPGDMLDKIADYARQTAQPIPETPGQFIRCCLESLALTYRRTLEQLQSVLDRKFDVLHLVGGGGKNELLCQMTADALHLPVVAGPYEATAMGNVLVQAIAAGELKDLAQARELVQASISPRLYDPRDSAAWTAAYERFARLG